MEFCLTVVAVHACLHMPMTTSTELHAGTYTFTVLYCTLYYRHKNHLGDAIQMDYVFARPDGYAFDPDRTQLPRPEYPITNPSTRKYVAEALIRLLAQLSGSRNPERFSRMLNAVFNRLATSNATALDAY